MNYPERWENHKPHGDFVSEQLDEYKNKFDWRVDGGDSVMDIGCGGGSITMERILPIMPSNFHRLIGVDISENMIAYAQKTYSHSKVEFKTFDIIDGDADELPQVDRIISIYLFHLLHDHEKALSNIYNLLKPGGDCFIMFITSFPYHTAFEQLARYPKWSKYIQDVSGAVPPSYYSKNPRFDFEQLLKKCNFSRLEVSIGQEIFGTIHKLPIIYWGLTKAYASYIFEIFSIRFGVQEELSEVLNFERAKFVNGPRRQNFKTTIDAFYEDIPLAEHDAFTTDFAELSANIFNSSANIKQSNNVYIQVDHLIAYAKK